MESFRSSVPQTTGKEWHLYHTAQHALSVARDTVDEAAYSKAVRNARREVNSTLAELAAQLPTLEYKPAKAKHGLFA